MQYPITVSTQWRNSSGPPNQTLMVDRADFPKHLGKVLSLTSGGANGKQLIGTRLLAPRDFNQALWICRGVQLVAAYRIATLEGRSPSLVRLTDEVLPSPKLGAGVTEEEANLILAKYFMVSSLTGSKAPMPRELLWRFVDALPHRKHEELEQILLTRNPSFELAVALNPQTQMSVDQLRSEVIRLQTMAREQRQTLKRGDTKERKEPLKLTELMALRRHVDHRVSSFDVGNQSEDDLRKELVFRRCAIAEFDRVGARPPFCPFTPHSERPPNLWVGLLDVQIALWCNELDEAKAIANELPDLARNEKDPSLIDDFGKTALLTWPLRPNTSIERQFVDDNRLPIFNLWIAHADRRSRLAESTLTEENLKNWYGGGIYRSSEKALLAQGATTAALVLPKTISNRLIDPELCGVLWPLLQSEQSDNLQYTRVMNQKVASLDASWMKIDSRDLTPSERRLGKIAAAFSSWWNGDPDRCERELNHLAAEFPNDISLQAELARMEIERGAPDQAFARLDRLSSDDGMDKCQVSLARITLANKIGVTRLARQAAGELFEQGLIDNLIGGQASEVSYNSDARNALSSVGAEQDPNKKRRPNMFTKLRLATRLSDSGNPVTASELAISVIEHYVKQGSALPSSNVQRAIEMIKRSGRLQKVISTFQSEFAGNQESRIIVDVLSLLYLAADQVAEAEALWEESFAKTSATVDEILAEAEVEAEREQYHRSAILFLLAFERQSETWEEGWAKFTSAAEKSPYPDAIFDRLAKLRLERFSLFSICNAIQIRQSESFTESQFEFVRRVLQSHPQASLDKGLLKRFVPERERERLTAAGSLQDSASP